MGDSLMKPFVLMISFIGVTIVLLGAMNNLQQSNMMAGDTDTGMAALAGFNYTMLNPTDGRAITWVNATDNEKDASDNGYPDPAIPHSVFWANDITAYSRGAIWVYCLRNATWDDWTYIAEPKEIQRAEGTRDALIFAQKYTKHGWFDVSIGVGWRYYVLPYTTISQHSKGNLSSIDFMFGGENYTAFVVTPGSGAFDGGLYTNNTFALALGQVWGLDHVGKTSMWKLVGQLLTCSLPNTNLYANLIMTISIWAVIAYVAIAMISRFIPTISGL